MMMPDEQPWDAERARPLTDGAESGGDGAESRDEGADVRTVPASRGSARTESSARLSDEGEQEADLLDSLPDEEDEGEMGGALYEHFRVVADRGQQLLRVDKFLMDHLRDTSRNRIQQAARAGFIHVNERPVKSNYRVKPFDVVTLVLDRPRFDNRIVPEEIPLNVVYEDAELIVIDKPAGLVVHPGWGNYHGTLVHAIAWHLRENADYDPNDPSVGLVHRIDKDTSGLLVVAKTPNAKTKLGLQFFHKTTRRQYNALVWGNVAADRGTIVGNIGRNPADRLQMAVFPEGSDQGKHAVTHYRVLERFGYVTLVECVLETGRTHQIRAHMKHLGHPLFNDARYGGDQVLRGTTSGSYKAFIRNAFELCPRQALHARTLGFRHPTTGEEMDFSSPLAPDIEALIEKWRGFTAAIK